MTSTALPSTTTLLSSSWKILTQHWRLLTALKLIPTLTTLLFFSSFGVTVPLLSHTPIGEALSSGSVSAPVPFVAALSLGFFLLVFIITINFWFQVATLITIRNRRSQPDFHQVIVQAWPLVGKYWWTSILGTLASLGGFIFLIIPGLLLSLYFSFSAQVVIAQKTSGLTALWTSRELIRNQVLAVIGRYLGLTVLIIFTSFAVQAGSQAWESAFGSPVGQSVSTFANLLASLATSIFTTIYSWLIYEELVKLRGQFQLTLTPRRRWLTWGLSILALIIIVLAFAALLNFLPYLPSIINSPNFPSLPNPGTLT
jgi:hypothetical protein